MVVGLAVAVLLGAAVLGRSAPPAPPAALEVSLRLADNTLVGSQSGVLVLPVEVTVGGAPLRLGESVLWGEPVRQNTTLSGRTRFEPGTTGRVQVLVQPDCSLLAPSQGHRLELTADLELLGPDGQSVRRVIDLGGEPAVAARVTALCAPPVAPPV